MKILSKHCVQIRDLYFDALYIVNAALVFFKHYSGNFKTTMRYVFQRTQKPFL